MGTAERRNAIIRALCRRRHDTMANFAAEFGVSERTIRRDIEILSLTEPIYTRSGRYGGGVYIMEGYYLDKLYVSHQELAVLQKVWDAIREHNVVRLDDEEKRIFEGIIVNYSKPTVDKNDKELL